MEARRCVSVVIARFEDLVARGLRALIDEDAHLEVAAADVPHSELGRAIADLAPDVAIVNFGSLRSASEVRDLHRSRPDARLVVMANQPSSVESNQMLAFGATACLSKETQARDILNAIHLASRGLHVLPRPPRDFAPAPTAPQLLTARESDVLELLQRGRSNAEIAVELHVGVETIRTHARNIYRKLGVSTRRELTPRSGRPEGSAGRGDPAAGPPAL